MKPLHLLQQGVAFCLLFGGCGDLADVTINVHKVEDLSDNATSIGNSLQIARSTLESQLGESRAREAEILSEIRIYEKEIGLQPLEDLRLDNAARKSSFYGEITNVKVEKLHINALLRQILEVQARVNARSEETNSSKFVDANIDDIKDFLAIDAIDKFGSVPALRKLLLHLEETRLDYERKYLALHPKMVENVRQIHGVKRMLQLEVKAAIEDLKDKYHDLESQEKEFLNAMTKVQDESVRLIQKETKLEEIKRNLRNQRDSTDAVKKRLQDVLIQLSLPSSGDDSGLAENEKKRLSQEGDRIIASVRVGDFSWTKTPQDGIWVSSPGNWSPADPEAARVIGDYMAPH